jgi:signal transduction histidine kinase/ligand-binding sensor domain-containing protein
LFRTILVLLIRLAVLIYPFLFAPPALLAQFRSLDVSQYLHASWTAKEGYFQGGLAAITQTSDGYLWLTSTAGLLRFDGVRFVEWKPPERHELPLQIETLFGSNDGSLWIGGQGLAELKATGEFRRYYELDGINVEELVEDRDGTIWAGGTARAGGSPLCHISRAVARCYGDAKFMGGWVSALFNDGEGRFWAGTNDGIWKIRSGVPEKIVAYPSVIRTFADDADGGLLFSDGTEIKVLTAEGKIKDYPERIDGKPLRAWAILNDREGNLWFGTQGQGLVHVHEGRVDRFTTLDGLSFDYNDAIIQDREGSVWVASGNGLDQFSKPAVLSLTRKQGLSDQEVLSVLTDSKGVTWIGTVGGLDELKGGRLVKSEIKLPNNEVTSLFETSRGHLLVATNTRNGMVWLESDKAVPLNVASGENVFELSEDRRGDLWVVNRESGLLHLSSEGELVEAFSRDKLGIHAALLAFDPNRDGLWLTSGVGELWFFQGGKIVERYGPADGLGGGVLRDPQVDKDGGVWVSTRIGLARLMKGRITLLGRKNGLPCDAVHWMRRDDDQNVWLYMSCGLVSFSNKDLSLWIDHPSHSVTITHYLDNTEGVENLAWNGFYTPQTAKINDGRILFATTKSGLNVLDPRNLNQNRTPPPVYIEEVTVDGRPIKQADHLSLPKRARTVHFTFTALSLVAPRKVRFRYKLEGYDKDWSGPVALREVAYTNLPPNDYQFHVIACNNDGVWNNNPASLSFTVPPAWYQTIWFRLLCTLSALGAIYSIYLQRMRRYAAAMKIRFDERLEERTRLARDLHDTLLQSFQALMLRFQGASNLLPTRPVEAKERLEGAIDQAAQAIVEGRSAVQGLRTSSISNSDLTAAIRALGEELGASVAERTSPVFRVELEGSPVDLQPLVRDDVYRIAGEALRNAFRHAQAQHIEVEIRYDESQMRLRIRDDGRGIDSQVLNGGGAAGHWGLPGMRERAELIGGKLEVWSSSRSGTEIELTVPASIAYAAFGDRARWWFFRRTEKKS